MSGKVGQFDGGAYHRAAMTQVAAIAALALETARLIMNAVLGTLSAVITAMTAALRFEWEIPLVSQLYQYVTHTDEPLTPIGLMALIAAVRRRS